MSVRRAALLVPAIGLLALVACATPPRLASHLDWSRFTDEKVIEVITTNEDGSRLETNVWFVLVDGAGYLRTKDSHWLHNLRRDPDVRIRIEGVEYLQQAHEVTDPELIARVEAAGREKYGFEDRMIHIFRTSHPRVIALSPRDS